MANKVKADLLVVDDDPQLLALLVDTLTAIGYRATGAPGGLDALDILKHHRFDLMVTDIRMPNLDGIQLLKRVRRLYPELPVVFITGVATPDIINQATPDGFLAKPFRISHIEALVERTLKLGRKQSRSGVRKVLVVDHDNTFRTNLVETLDCSEFVPLAAATIEDAVRELESGHFDAVIADASVPRLRGHTLSEIMAKRFPDTPLVLMSGELSAEDLIDGHYSQFLRKPFQAGTLLQLLDELALAPQSR